MRNILLLLYINIIISFGIEAVAVPQSALELASSNSGVGNSKNFRSNFALINNVKSQISFSNISWYQDVVGTNVDIKWNKKYHHYISLFSLSSSDIGLWLDVPYDEPIDYFDINHISLAYGLGKNLTDWLNIGIKSTVVYNNIYVDESFGYYFDLGVSYKYNSNLYLGFALNKLGTEKTNNSDITYPLEAGLGLTYNFSAFKTMLNTDIIYNESFNEPIQIKISTKTKISALSLISGYNFGYSEQHFSSGFSFKYRKIQFDYGIAFHSSLGNPIILSLKYQI
ncbi:hypothetical protein N9597_00320 [Candidatus Marinimicrobia bacterium]|nr:hypothetical protein [Candidatus Neomarinimicrobiota bacterium]